MSTKRILAITVFSVLFIIIFIAVMLLTTFITRNNDVLQLPDTSASADRPDTVETDPLDRIEATRDTIQAIVATLNRPEVYSRDVAIESYWEGGYVEYSINVSVSGGMTSVSSLSSAGIEKRIIVTPDALYIWYKGDKVPYTGNIDSAGDGLRTADEYQKLATYEDIIQFSKNDITDAGYVEYNGEDCVYAEYRSPLIGYTMKYYVSIALGLITAAEEYNESGTLVYRMVTGECIVGEIDPAAFELPDGTVLG